MRVSLLDSEITATSIQRSHVHSKRLIRSNQFQNGRDCSLDQTPIGQISEKVCEKLMDSAVDFRLPETAEEYMSTASPDFSTGLLELSGDFSDISSFNSDISVELQQLASFFDGDVFYSDCDESAPNGLGLGFVSSISTKILESGSLEFVKSMVRSCVETLGTPSSSPEEKRGAASKLRILAKHRSDFRELIGTSGAIQTLIPLLCSTDSIVQENAVTSLLNLSLEESNKTPIIIAGAIKPLIYALRTGTATSKQNAACALLNLSMIEETQITIGLCGAIPPLVSLLVNGSMRGKKDALTTLYKLCGARKNKELAVNAGAVTQLIALVAEGMRGTAEKAMVILSRLSEIEEGREAIVEEGGIPALVEAVEIGPENWKEFAVITLLQICRDSEINRGLVVREGAMRSLVALSQSESSSSIAKQKANILLKYLRESGREGASLAARRK